MQDIPDFVFRSFFFQNEPIKRLLVQSQQLEQSMKKCSQLKINVAQRHHRRRSSVLILNLEQFFTPYSCALIANFEQVIVYWERSYHKNNLSKRDLFFHLVLQLLKFVL